MTGYHVNWSGPRSRNWTDWEILLQILSIRMYQESIGPMKLVCDQASHDFFDRIGVLEIYDGVELFDESLLEGIDPDIYFAAGKILAQLQVEDEECAFIDTDLLILNKQTPFANHNVTVFHREIADQSVYPNHWDHWKMEIPVDESVFPLNCALVVWCQKELRRNYASMAMKFMRNNTYHTEGNKNALMVTAEQRLLGLYLKHIGIIPDYYIKDIYICQNKEDATMDWQQDGLGSNIEKLNQDFFHLWGHKNYLVNNPLAAAEYTLNLYTLCEKYPELKIDKILHKLKN